MQGFWWKLPWLRRLSAVGRGTVEAAAAVVVAAGAALIVVFAWHLDPDQATAGTLAQVGATILVAYGVEASWLLKRSHVRSKTRESWVGVASGLAFCGLLGIGCAIALSSESEASQTFFQKMLLAWTLGSIGSLGIFVALVPNLVYEWTHQIDTVEDDD